MNANHLRRGIAASSLALCSIVGVACHLTGCHLTPQQAAIFNAIDPPICTAIGGGLTVVTAPLGALVAVLCPAIAAEIVNAEEQAAAADAGAPSQDGGVTARLSSASGPTLSATPGCKPVRIPNDPFHQSACPELHEKILAAEMRAVVKAASQQPQTLDRLGH